VTSAPRIDPLDEDPEGLLSLNIFRTMAKHRPLAERFSRFGGYLLFKGLLPAREREIVILRVGWRSDSVYEFGQHTVMGMDAGLTSDEIERLALESLDGWTEDDKALIAMADELCSANDVTDPTWASLASRWSEEELMELLVVAGFYRMVSGFLNSVGVQLDPDTPGWPGSSLAG
jgi:4-carboxymuconolactone decarboxylase